MYERSAILIEKYFIEKLGYNEKSNLKNNCMNYFNLVDNLEEYQDVYKEEDNIMKECEDIAKNITKIQKKQNALGAEAIKLQEEKMELFENIDESASNLEKLLKKVEKRIQENIDEITPLNDEFVDIRKEFEEKSMIRADCGRRRKKIEKDYQKALKNTESNGSNIDKEKIYEVKKFTEFEDTIVNRDLNLILTKNGENETVPFDADVIKNAITLSKELYKKEATLLMQIYDKSVEIIDEINNNNVSLLKHKTIVQNTKHKLEFIQIQREYLIQFLDNERLSVGLGELEHAKLMEEACENLEEDVEQMNNLYDLMLMQMAKKANKKTYIELYNYEYLARLKKKEDEFEEEVKKLNLIGKVINPVYWRIDSIKKIYSLFETIVTEEYDVKLAELKHIFMEDDDESDNLINNADSKSSKKFREIQEIKEKQRNSRVSAVTSTKERTKRKPKYVEEVDELEDDDEYEEEIDIYTSNGLKNEMEDADERLSQMLKPKKTKTSKAETTTKKSGFLKKMKGKNKEATV